MAVLLYWLRLYVDSCKMKKTTRRIIVIGILLILLGIILYPKVKPLFSSLDDGGAAAGQQRGGSRSLNVVGVVLQKQEMFAKIRSTGTLIADEEVDLSFETSGKVIKIDFKEGSHVKKGQILAKVNDAQLQAQLQKLEAQYKLAEDRLYRQKALLEKDAISREAYEQAETEIQTLNADVELVKAKIAETELCAPFDGIVGLRYISEGAYATPSTKVARLVKLDPIKVEFSVPGQYASEVHLGSLIKFEVQMGDKLVDFYKPITAIEPMVDVDTRSLLIRSSFENKNERLLPGMYVSVEVVLSETDNALAVPSEAIISEMGISKVYLYKDGRAVSTDITPGMRTESHVQVLEGLKLGDTLIASGMLQLREGMPVVLDTIQ